MILDFGLQFGLLFCHMVHQALAALCHIGCNTQCRTLDVAKNLGRDVSCTESIAQANDCEFILTVIN